MHRLSENIKSHLLLRALETGIKASLQQYIVFILQCPKVKNNCQILLKIAETIIALIVFKFNCFL